MRRSTYIFEIVDETGKPLQHLAQRCDNIRAREKVFGLLEDTPDAAAVFGYDQSGFSVHAAYRE